jgi:hypothetical protein
MQGALTSAARQAGGWQKVLGAERAEDFKRLTSQLLTQLSPRMRQLQQFSPLRVMVRRFGQLTSPGTQPPHEQRPRATPQVLEVGGDGEVSDENTSRDSDAGLSDIGLVELPFEVTRMVRASPPLVCVHTVSRRASRGGRCCEYAYEADGHWV